MHELLNVLHRSVGMVALASGLVALCSRKGGGAHRAAGRIFFGAMFAASVTAGVLGARRSIVFSMLLAAMCACFLLAGMVALRHRARPTPQALCLSVAISACGIGFLILHEPHHVVFGLGALSLSITDVLAWRTPRPRNWWFAHMKYMLAAFTVAIFAYCTSSRTLEALLSVRVVTWGPLVLGIATIALWTNHYRQRFARTSRAASARETP